MTLFASLCATERANLAHAQATPRPAICIKASAPVQPAAVAPTLTPAEEEKALREILTSAIATYESKYGKRVGRGWCGNMFGHGDKCNVVHDRMETIIEKSVREQVNERGVPFQHYDIGTIVASGRIAEAVSGHVYMALYRVDPTTGSRLKTVATFDPWRSRAGIFKVDPNVGAEAPIMWMLPKMRPQPKP